MMKKRRFFPVTALFFGAVFLMAGLNLLSPDQERSEMENRALQQLPKVTVSGLLDSSKRGFAQKFETYLADQFVGRNAWITVKSVTEAALGKTENNGVAYGRDGYLFGICRTCDEETLFANVDAIRELAKTYPEIPMDTMIVPSAYEVLTEQAPAGLGNIDELAYLDEINALFSADGIGTVDAVSALSTHRDDAQLYYRTDHHWTSDGAFFAFEAYLTESGFLPAAYLDSSAPFSLEMDESLRREQDGFLGTYYSKAKKFDTVADAIVWYDVPVDRVTINGEEANGLYDLDKLLTRDKYAMFLHGNNGVTVIENSSAPSGSLLVIKDSFANSLVPYLTKAYSRITVVDLRYLPQGFTELMETQQFDRVLVLYSFENLMSDDNFYRLRY